MTPLARIIIAVVVFASACAPDVDAGGPPIPVRYDSALTANGFVSAVVTLTIGGAQAVFLVDTGASVHTFARWFVDASGLRPEATDRRTIGSTGHESRVELVSMVAGTLDNGRRLVIPQAIVADFPPLFAAHRIGGLLSPQLLAGSGEEAILDLRKPQLTFRAARTRASAKSGDGKGDADGVCTNRESPFRNRLYAIVVQLDDEPATLLIDTGATRTMLSTTSPAAERFANRTVAGGESQGVGGVAEKVRRIPAVEVMRGGATASLDLGLGSASNRCGPDGLLGMDALRRCVLILGELRIGLTCDRQ